MFDIGVNLISLQFFCDYDEVVVCVLVVGVNGMLLIGINLVESQQVQKLVSCYFGCWFMVGVYFYDGSSWMLVVVEVIYIFVGELQVVVIGECGLDFNWNFFMLYEQEVVFSVQLVLVVELLMLVFLYCCDVYDWFLMLFKFWFEKILGVVLYCFIGSCSEVQECLDLGLFIGIIGWVCDEWWGLELCELLLVILVECLLLEIDVFYLLLCDFKLKLVLWCNEFVYLLYILVSVVVWCGEEV